MSGTSPNTGTAAIFGTSSALQFPSTPITDDEKVDIRRFCGYSLYGNSASGFLGYRFFEAQGFLEYRMINCAPSEAQRIRRFMALIFPLEDVIATASGNMDTLEAGPLKLDPREVAKRVDLMNVYRVQLVNFLGVPPRPDLEDAGSSGGRIVI